MSSASSSGAIAQAAGSNAAEQTSGRGASAVSRTIRRPTAMTRNGIRQFVETEHGVRLFLQNCVATINLQTKPDLAHIATHARNAEYNPRRFAAVIMRLREPKATGLIFQSGKMVVTGAKNEDDSLLAARKLARIIQRLGFNAGFTEFKIQNLVATGDLGFPIRLEGIADEHGRFCSYEPELFAGLIYRMEDPRLVILVFVSGRIVVTGGKARSAVVKAVQNLYPVLIKYRKQLPAAPGPKRSKNAPTSTSIVVTGHGVGTA